MRLITIVPDKITTPANTKAAPVASPVNGRPGLSSVVVEVVLVVPGATVVVVEALVTVVVGASVVVGVVV